MNSYTVTKLLWIVPLLLLLASVEASGQHRPTYPHPPQAAGTAKQVAHAVLYLTSEDASYITGQVLTMDGGLS